MKKFVFQLETFLKISIIEREKTEVALAAAVQNLIRQKSVQQLLQQELADNLQEYNTLLKGKTVNVGIMQIYNNFFTWKRSQIDLQITAVHQADKKKQDCFRALLRQQKRVKSLEQLRQKRFDEYKYEMLAEEQKQIDEIGLQVHMRRV
ncbi:flagellar export protein FliJ [Pectinatus frisingensis]|uniref:flagellar export protein FliJ n=1 Tax=Pectinatus frisingensis TaxID=865 RepID=UPI0018C7AD88